MIWIVFFLLPTTHLLFQACMKSFEEKIKKKIWLHTPLINGGKNEVDNENIFSKNSLCYWKVQNKKEKYFASPKLCNFNNFEHAPRVQYACIQPRDKHMVLYTYDKLICPQLIYPFLAYFVEKQNWCLPCLPVSCWRTLGNYFAQISLTNVSIDLN